MKSKNDIWVGWHRIEDPDGSPYMLRVWVGRLRLHLFYRGDNDPDCHDHPWDFWTFPLTPYVEEVLDPLLKTTYSQVVPAWRMSFRPAEHCHRVLGRWAGRHIRLAGYVFDDENWPYYDSYDPNGSIIPLPGYYPAVSSRKIVTIVWRSPVKRKWGFLKHRDGKWCWVHWKEYVFNGGKEGPCE